MKTFKQKIEKVLMIKLSQKYKTLSGSSSSHWTLYSIQFNCGPLFYTSVLVLSVYFSIRLPGKPVITVFYKTYYSWSLS